MRDHDDANLIPDTSRFEGRDAPAGDELFPDGLDGDARGAAIRAAADGELTDLQAGSLESDSGAIAFERSLRDATARTMGGVTAPAGLRESILAASREASAADDAALADALHARAEQTRSASFWSGTRVVGAMAAALLLAVVGVFAWTSTQNGGSGGGLDTAYRTNLAQFVAGEHTRTLDEAYADRKYIYKAPDAAADAMKADLDRDPVIPPCGGATTFAGASPCGVPGKGPSAHMQFVLPVHDENGAIVEGAEGRKVSVFVKQDKGELELAEGTTYLVNAEACNLSDVYICVWRRNGLLYTLVSEDRNAPMCTTFLSQFGVDPPDPANSI